MPKSLARLDKERAYAWSQFYQKQEELIQTHIIIDTLNLSEKQLLRLYLGYEKLYPQFEIFPLGICRKFHMKKLFNSWKQTLIINLRPISSS